ncbi:MAG: ATP synthase F0 subunit B [Syntrophales bacterium]|nr:ATP synthase F0 subunit B [Deltaproteobacteria bacterium]
MVELNITIVYQMINFLVMIFILNLLLYKPILSIIEKRKKNFEDSENEIKRLNETIESKMAAYEEKVHQAKLEAVEEKSEIVKEGADKAKEIIEAVRSEVPGMMEGFRVKLDAEVSAAKAFLSGKSKELSVEIAEKVLGRSVQ